jgi:AraC-like DNA-binding protein
MHRVAPPPDAPSVSGSYAQALNAFLGSCGLSDGGPAAQGILGARIDGAALGDSLVDGGRVVGDPMLGIRFGTRVGCAGFGLLGIAAATASTLADAVGNLQRFESLTSTLGHVRVRREGTSVTLAWQPAQAVAPAVVEGILAGWVSFGRFLLGEDVAVRCLNFEHARGAATSAYEQLLQCPVRFGAAETSVTVGADLLDARPRFADARVNKAIGTWLDGCTVAVAAPAQRHATRRVAQLLAASPALDEVDECRVAAALGVGPRTLQRRLEVEGSSFRALLDAARAQHAVVALLHDATHLAQLSADIGFREQSSLCRAVRRWTGYAPLPLRTQFAPLFQYLRPAADETPAMGALLPAAHLRA